MSMSIRAQPRERSTKSAVKELRKQGRIPGVVYGKSVGSEAISVDAKELIALLRGHATGVVELETPNNGKQPVMLSGVQRDNISGNVLHVDFHQVNMNEPVRAEVPVELAGEPKGVKEGGILTVLVHQVEIRCLPTDIPSALVLQVDGLEIGDSVTAADLPLPEGVELLTDGQLVIATVLGVQKQGQDEEDPAVQSPSEQLEEKAETDHSVKS
ncbi:50S ribosomal protein L25 [Paenibacillus thermoaerophilus]|jgi:large subunit ribosomal protein L25|uniref:Large ribosomal subunit protein bL25 n=1 Tax=Paenibacillus thermoaerophilus TaxID=1215385 RepID=A0ABW2V7J9_9BACL|nr:50S ribosomal protein L25 [Paenibacillus thermoaerophilus]